MSGKGIACANPLTRYHSPMRATQVRCSVLRYAGIERERILSYRTIAFERSWGASSTKKHGSSTRHDATIRAHAWSAQSGTTSTCCTAGRPTLSSRHSPPRSWEQNSRPSTVPSAANEPSFSESRQYVSMLSSNQAGARRCSVRNGRRSVHPDRPQRDRRVVRPMRTRAVRPH
jgi:hypothetical protein